MKTILLSLCLLMAGIQAQAINITDVVPITSDHVQKYAKFEIGIALDAVFANPYDTDLVNVEVMFTSPTGKQYKVYAFYYIPFERNDLNDPPTQDLDQRVWDQVVTDYPWRARFSPNEAGTWTYIVHVDDIEKAESHSYDERAFECESSSNPGFLKTSINRRYLEFSEGQSFWGVAEDMRAHSNNVPAYDGWSALSVKWRYSPLTLRKHFEWIDKFKLAGGNYVRIWLEPYSYDIEWETLNDYTERQNRMSDLDTLIEYAHAQEVYIHLTILNEQHLKIQNDFEVANWYDNPYRNGLGLSEPAMFYIDTMARHIYKKRLRYIHARWGYSTAIASYGLVNEPEFLGSYDTASFPNENITIRYDSIVNTDFEEWVQEMGGYLQKESSPRHLNSVDFAFLRSDANWKDAVDFSNTHCYGWDKHVEYQRNYTAQYHMKNYRKPFTITEFSNSPARCWISVYNEYEIHTGIWSTAMYGSMGNAFYFGGETKYRNPTWGGDKIKKFTPLSRFMADETFNTYPDFYKPVGNAKSAYRLYSNVFGPLYNCPPPSMPIVDRAGFAYAKWNMQLLDTAYLVDNISTNMDTLIEVFALQKNEKVIGWLHHKDYYWYNIRHTVSPGCSGPELDALSDTTCNYVVVHTPLVLADFNDLGDTLINFNPIEDAVMTIRNLRCNGVYRIDWYSTQFNYDIDNDLIPDDGGIIPSRTEYFVVNNNTATVSIPKLTTVELGGPPFAPDYGFKITFLNSSSYENGRWMHIYPDSLMPDWFTPSNHKVAGAIAYDSNNQLYYRDSSGYMNHFYFDSTLQDYRHDGLVPLWWTQDADHKIEETSPIVITGKDHVFYTGTDGKMQYYAWDGTEWMHFYPDGATNHQVAGAIAYDSNNHVYYRGGNEYMQHFYWNNGTSSYDHDFLTTAGITTDNRVDAASPIVINGVDHVFYKGTDGYMQYYYWDGSAWKHSYPAGPTKYGVAGSIATDTHNQIYYRGSDGYMQHFYWDSLLSAYVHDGLLPSWTLQSTNHKVAVESPIVINGRDHVFYKGADGKMQYYFWTGSVWNHAYAGDSISNFQVDGAITCDTQDQIYYRGADGYMEHFYWDNTSQAYVHDGLVSSWWTQNNNYRVKAVSPVVSNGRNHIFYRGADDKMQYYKWDNSCTADEPGEGRPANKIPQIVSIQSKTNNRDSLFVLKYYPNPFYDLFNIEIISEGAKQAKLQVEVYDMIGSRVYYTSSNVYLETGVNKWQYDFSTLSPGIYQMKVKLNNTEFKTIQVIRTN